MLQKIILQTFLFHMVFCGPVKNINVFPGLNIEPIVINKDFLNSINKTKNIKNDSYILNSNFEDMNYRKDYIQMIDYKQKSATEKADDLYADYDNAARIKLHDYSNKKRNSAYINRKSYKKIRRALAHLYSIRPTTKPSLLMERLLQNYIKIDPPSVTHKNATRVQLGVFIISVYSVNEQTMDYSVSMYLRQSWNDPRLSFTRFNMTYNKLRMGTGSWNNIWIPDTFLRNEKGASFHKVTVENRFLSLYNEGTLWYVTKITASLSCPMRLENFPMDTQVCPMAFESFGYQMNTMFFKSMTKMIDKKGDLQLPQFTLVNHTHRDCSQNYTTGSYPCLEINFFLKRDLGYFLIQVYVPSVLIVILSWVSFWINVDASPARVSIGLLTVLTTTTMSSSARSTLPRVSYIKAIDVWMIVCLVFVFTSLIEFAVVNVLSRKVTKPKRPISQHPGPILKRKTSKNCCVLVQQVQRRKINFLNNCRFCKSKDKAANAPEPDGKMKARSVDKLSRKIFPLTFTIFNFIYWIYYLQQPEKTVV